MKSKFLLSISLLLVAMTSQAFDIIKFEPAVLEVDYIKHIVLDTINPDTDFCDTPMTLRIGNNTSSFFPPQKVWRDSLLHYNFKLEYQLHKERLENGLPSLGGREKERVYKNHPKDSITVTNTYSMSQWIYSETWEKPTWRLLDSIATVMSYECQLAVCDYRGRTWYAFFTTDIPISDGPWKLCGLPGLILKAWDSKEHYLFEAIGARTENLQEVGIYNYLVSDYLKTTRDRYYEDWFEALHEDVGYKMAQAGAFGISPSAVPAPRKLPHRNHDFEETTYKHKHQ